MSWADFEKSLFGKASTSGSEKAGTQTPSRTLNIIPNAVVQIRKFSSRFAQRLGLTSGQQGLDGYVSDLLAAMALNRFNPEDYFPDEILACMTGGAGALALNFSRVALVNPVGSGVLAVVTRIAATSSGGASAFQVGTDAAQTATFAALTLSVAGAFRDGRVGNPSFTGGATRCFMHNGTAAAAFANGPLLVRQAPASAEAEWGNADDAIFILAPGQAVIVTPGVVNFAITAEFWWRERPLNS
jgi:hypothetical protein